MFELHPQLAKDSIVLGEFPVSLLLLMNDSQYPWFILVPQRTGISEAFELSNEDYVQVNQESRLLASTLATVFNADKLNIAALGNVVPQLHIHHIVRYRDDISWPAPIWGKHAPKPYEASILKTTLEKLDGKLGDQFRKIRL